MTAPPAPSSRAARMAGAAALVLLAVGLAAPLPWLTPPERAALGVTLFALVLWTAQPVPVEVSSLAVLLLLPAAGLLDFAGAFAPFAGATVWLVFAGMVLSLMLTETGLGHRWAQACVPLFARGGPVRLVAGLHALGLAAAFLVPSGVVRVLLLMPVGQALCRALDPQARDPELPTTVTLSLLCGTYFGGCGVLTGSVPNLVVAGQLEAVTGRVLYWGEWLLWMFPVLGGLRTAVCIAVVWSLWGRHLRPWSALPAPGPAGARPPGQRRTMLLLALGVALWATDVLHGLAPVYVGLGLALAAVTPRWGPLTPGHLRQANFPFLFYLAALFGIGAALDGTGFNGRVVHTALGLAPAEGHWLARHLALAAAALPLDFLMDIAAVGAVATPSLLQAGAAAGLDPVAAAFSVAMAVTVAFLPYQAAPCMVALGFGLVRPRALAAAMLLVSGVSTLVLFPLNVLYWRWLGLI